MWQLIQLNKRRSMILLLVMAIIMLLLGAIIGQAIGTFSANYQPEKMVAAVDRGDQNWLFSGMTDNLLENPWWLYGMAVAFALWLVQVLVAYYAGGDIML
ncbi:MAG: hypothetical protein JXM68_14785, partial [Sedimentisphaerales bacterium]|nr:hypothetical protein [Sedimentisphaerales bacterium]